MLGTASSRLAVFLLSAALSSVTHPGVAWAQQVAEESNDPLTGIKELYESAEYDDALAAIRRASATSLTAAQSRDVRIYEALCLLALGKKTEAEARVEEVIRAEPLYEPSTEFPKRLRTLVEETRAKLRPSIAQARYQAGKELFDAEKYEQASQELSLVLQLTDPGVDSSREMRDLRLLATGFRDLAVRSMAAAKPEPAPQTPPPASASAPAPAPASAPAGQAPERAAGDGGVVPPVIIRQNLPAWPAIPGDPHRQAARLQQLSGVLEVVVGKTGKVDSARLVDPIEPFYDRLLLEAARQWRYEPATQNGEPVDYVKRVAINIR
jgi:TonB family protein